MLIIAIYHLHLTAFISVELIYDDVNTNPIYVTGALLTGPLLVVYWGQLTRESWPEHGVSSERHVWATPDSQTQHVHCRGAWERASEEIQLIGTHADEQF